MAASQRARVFVLRSVDYGDRDLIVTLFGRQTGKFAAIAKNARGSKRRFGGGLQPMRLLEAHYTAKPNRDLARLSEIDVLRDFAALEGNYDKITIGSYATELLRSVTVEEDPEPAVFDLTEHFYERLSEADDRVGVLEVTLRHFELQLLSHLGLAPAVEACLRCATPVETMAKVYGLRSGEGILCPECVRTGEAVGVLYPATLEVVDYFTRPDGSVPDGFRDEETYRQARRMVDAAVEHVLDQPLKSRAMLDTVINPSDTP
jgi:DNA repair protein RecO (recombination protein O)